MPAIDRRKFLGVAGISSVAAATAVVSGSEVSRLAGGTDKLSPRAKPASMTFRAETGLPVRPWAAYATAMVEGSVDLQSGTGLVTTRVVAGPPGNGGDIGLPGTARLVRITKATTTGGVVNLQGVVEDRSTLAKGESARRTFVLDRTNKQLHTELIGTNLSLALV